MSAEGIVDVLEEPVFDLVCAAAEDFGEVDGGAVEEFWFVFVSLEVG